MKITKIIIIAMTVLSLLLSIVTALNMDWDADSADPPKENNSSEEVLFNTHIRYCECDECKGSDFSSQYYIIDGHTGCQWINDYSGDYKILSKEDLYVGREVTVVSEGVFSFGDVLDGENKKFTMDLGECFEIVLGKELWFWVH